MTVGAPQDDGPVTHPEERERDASGPARQGVRQVGLFAVRAQQSFGVWDRELRSGDITARLY
jgi:hypothetical protein